MHAGYWLALAAACVAGCAATGDGERGHEVVSVRLSASRQNLGQMAVVTLVSRGEKTGLTFLIGGVPPYIARPVRLYTYIYAGSCGNLAAKPAYEMNQTLNPVKDTASGPWTLSKVAPVAFSDLLSADYAIVVRAAPSDGSIDLFCGDAGAAKPAATDPVLHPLGSATKTGRALRGLLRRPTRNVLPA
jgi:hypothetical protein